MAPAADVANGPQAKVLAHPWETTTWPGQSPSAAEFAGRVWG